MVVREESRWNIDPYPGNLVRLQWDLGDYVERSVSSRKEVFLLPI